MKRIIPLLFSLLALAPIAEAQTMPNTGQVYFVGSHDQLILWHAAITKLFCAQSLAHGANGCVPNPYTYEYPFEGPNARPNILIPGPWGLDPDEDCMTAYYGGPTQNWNDGTGIYIGTQDVQIDMDSTSGVDWVSVDVPGAGDLVTVDNLPQICKEKLLNDYCGPIPGYWADMMCEWEELYCCES